jgi:hypothetical protein
VEKLVEEARIHQVEHRVLGAADILIDVHPFGSVREIPRRDVVVRIQIAQIVP